MKWNSSATVKSIHNLVYDYVKGGTAVFMVSLRKSKVSGHPFPHSVTAGRCVNKLQVPVSSSLAE